MSELKKTFQLDVNSDVYQDLCTIDAEIQVNQSILTIAKEGLIEAIVDRNQLIRETLLNNYNYILSSNDKVHFFEQTGELRIYDQGT